MAVDRYGHTATLLQDGRVLVAGGVDNAVLASAELYDPTTGTFSPTGDMTVPRVGHTATLLLDGRVLIAGGANDANGTLNKPVYSAEIYDPRTGTFAAIGHMPGPTGSTATLLKDGRVLFAGGVTYTGAYSAAAEPLRPCERDLQGDRRSSRAAKSPHRDTAP